VVTVFPIIIGITFVFALTSTFPSINILFTFSLLRMDYDARLLLGMVLSVCTC
jgi:hypothetical protein